MLKRNAMQFLKLMRDQLSVRTRIERLAKERVPIRSNRLVRCPHVEWVLSSIVASCLMSAFTLSFSSHSPTIPLLCAVFSPFVHIELLFNTQLYARALIHRIYVVLLRRLCSSAQNSFIAIDWVRIAFWMIQHITLYVTCRFLSYILT